MLEDWKRLHGDTKSLISIIYSFADINASNFCHCEMGTSSCSITTRMREVNVVCVTISFMKHGILLFLVHRIRKHHYQVQSCTSLANHSQPYTCIVRKGFDHWSKSQRNIFIMLIRQLPVIGVLWMEIEHKNQIATFEHNYLAWIKQLSTFKL